MVRKAGYVKQGDLSVGKLEFMPAHKRGPKSRRTGVRAAIVAWKRRNGRGAKGGREVDRPKAMDSEATPVGVPGVGGAKQAGDIRARWAWVEPSVWTQAMLSALEDGVKGGVWYSLMDKVYALRNLRAAFRRVEANRGSAGVDRQTIERFASREAEQLDRLHQELQDGHYRPQPVRRVWIPKPGGRERRPLGIPTVRDRVVQTALRHVLEPIYERRFAEHSYGFRPGRGCKDALRRVWQLLRQGYVHVVDADLKGYFDSIPHDRLLQRMAEEVADSRVLELLRAYLEQGVMDTMGHWTPETGTPQGAVISPLLSNVYLNPLDHEMARGGLEMVRYADDFVILCRSEGQAQRALALVQAWVGANGLTLHPDKTRIVDVRQPGGFDFLGYHFERGMKWPRAKSYQKFKDTVRHKTPRHHGASLTAIIHELNPTLRGWYEYFKHSHWNVYPSVDGWVRMRLRSILRKRTRRRGRGRGLDHHRWPNAYFTAHGLFSLQAAYAADRQLSYENH